MTLAGSGTQPHELFVQVSPPPHAPQLTGCPQLFVVDPQRLLHQFASGVHWHAPLVHVFPAPQSVEHVRVWLQLSCVAPHLFAQVTEFGSGVQLLTGEPLLDPGAAASPPLLLAPLLPPLDAFGSTEPASRVASSARRALSKSTPASVWHPVATEVATHRTTAAKTPAPFWKKVVFRTQRTV